MSLQNPRRFAVQHRIRFSECDPAGIVFYPQYFVMFNDVLEAWFDSLLPNIGFRGFLIDRRIGLPTVRLDAEFKAVSQMGDDVVLTLAVERLTEKSLTLALDCTGTDNVLRMRVLQTIVTTSLVTHKAIPIPAELRQALAADIPNP